MKICMRTGAHWAWQLAGVGQLRVACWGEKLRKWWVRVKKRAKSALFWGKIFFEVSGTAQMPHTVQVRVISDSLTLPDCFEQGNASCYGNIKAAQFTDHGDRNKKITRFSCQSAQAFAL